MKNLIAAIALWIVSNTAAAGFACSTSADFAGDFSGVISGTSFGIPASAFFFLAVNPFGEIAIFAYASAPGLVGLATFDTGTVVISDPATCAGTLRFNDGEQYYARVVNGGDTIIFATPFDASTQASGTAWRN